MATMAQRVVEIKSHLRTYITPDQILMACRHPSHESRSCQTLVGVPHWRLNRL